MNFDNEELPPIVLVADLSGPARYPTRVALITGHLGADFLLRVLERDLGVSMSDIPGCLIDVDKLYSPPSFDNEEIIKSIPLISSLSCHFFTRHEDLPHFFYSIKNDNKSRNKGWRESLRQANQRSHLRSKVR